MTLLRRSVFGKPALAVSTKEVSSLPGQVHSDVCGKMGAEFLAGAEYFLIFIDNYTRYVCVYPLKRKTRLITF